MTNKKLIGCRKRKLDASILRGKYVSKRKNKPYKADVIKKGGKYCVRIQEKK